jgi:23S rRNA (guanosine2251-2'-O)-methyltransferase
MRIVTGFHPIEEELRSAEKTKEMRGFEIIYARPGPRVKKILQTAKDLSIPTREEKTDELDKLAQSLPITTRDHRGIALIMHDAEEEAPLRFEDCVKDLSTRETALVILLDSITDPHNVGAIIRSADQFGVDLVVIPDHRGSTDFEVISRTSAGATSWVNVVLATNLVRAVETLKDAGFWVYGADAGGKPAASLKFSGKTGLVMGSEGSGLARLLREKCDEIVSIPTSGKLDSLNVSVAAGILLYEIRRTQ